MLSTSYMPDLIYIQSIFNIIQKHNLCIFHLVAFFDRKSSQWQWSIHLLRQLQRVQLKANVVAYNAAIDACQDDGDMMGFLGIIHLTMEGKLYYVIMNVISYISLGHIH